jgi:NAD(P)H-dependent FMN reductase
LRKVLGSAGARVINRELPVPSAGEAFNEDGGLKDSDTTLELGSVIAELLASARRRLAA